MKEKIKKYVKWKKVYLVIIALSFVMLIPYSMLNIIKYAPMDKSLFEVKMASDELWQQTYCLFINGENIDMVDYNDYMGNLDKNGNPNVKLCVILNELKQLNKSILLVLIFTFVYFLFENAGELLSKKNLSRIRKIGILSILLTIIPSGVVEIGKFIYFRSIVSGTSQFPYIFLIGVFLVIFARLLEYWNNQREDDNNIIETEM